MATTEPVYGIIKLKAEATNSYPSENYDWGQSGLYKQILKKYNSDVELVQKARSKPSRDRNDIMNDSGYRAAMGIMLIGNGD